MSESHYDAQQKEEEERNTLQDAFDLRVQDKVRDIRAQFRNAGTYGLSPTEDMSDVIAAICDPSNEKFFIKAFQEELKASNHGIGKSLGFVFVQATYYVATKAVEAEDD